MVLAFWQEMPKILETFQGGPGRETRGEPVAPARRKTRRNDGLEEDGMSSGTQNMSTAVHTPSAQQAQIQIYWQNEAELVSQHRNSMK